MQPKVFVTLLVIALLGGGFVGYLIGHKVGTVEQQFKTVNTAIKVTDKVADSILNRLK